MAPALLQPTPADCLAQPSVDKINGVQVSAAKSDLNNSTDTEVGHPPTTDDDHAVLGIRNLVLDVCMQNGGGHGGSALGMAAIGVALWKYVMRYNPSNPNWFDRDRFVLSNGEMLDSINRHIDRS